MSIKTTSALAALTGRAASDELIEDFARAVLERFAHEHPERGEDFFCLNLTAYMGERMHAVLLRLRDAEAKIRAEERARCIAELRAYSAERMSAAVSEVTAGKDEGFAGVAHAAAIEKAARLLESGELATTATAETGGA